MPNPNGARLLSGRRSAGVVLGALLAVAAFAAGLIAARADRHASAEALKRKPPARPVVDRWQPLARQRAEADTLYLLNPEAERALAPGAGGGLIMGNAGAGDLPWQPTSKVAIVPGRYRAGLQSRERQYGYLWSPISGLLGAREFTVEMWLSSAVPWGQLADQTPFAVVAGVDEGLQLWIQRGVLNFTMSHRQATAAKTETTLSWNAAHLPAAEWHQVAATYRKGTLRLFVDGAPVAEEAGVPPPQVWGDVARSSGLSIGGARGRGATQMAISDLRISRRARTPGRRPAGAAVQSLRVRPRRDTGRGVRRGLLGALHSFRGRRTERLGRGVITMLRTDKLLTATPIKPGPPDAAHPVPGVSGAFSYDWRAVDRAFADMRRVRVRPYISVDATPQLLGGAIPPPPRDELRTILPHQVPFAPQVPRDLAAFAAMTRDLVHHVTVELRADVAYWGVWNEPDAPNFWKGTLDDYLRLYSVVAAAVKSVDPRQRVGGPEAARWSPEWIEALIRHAAATRTPLDFVSWHYYSGNLSEFRTARLALADLAARYGLARRPGLVVGEWAWQSANLPGTGQAPFRTSNFFLNDWAAAFAAASLVEMQREGIEGAVYTNAVARRAGQGFEGTGLMSPGRPWATLNVFRLWRKLAPRVVATRLDARPGISAIASRGKRGRLTVLVSRLQYRPGPAVNLDVGWGRRMRVLRHYVVDARHSNAFDAGPRRADLHAVRAPRTARRLTVALAPRSVHLLVLGRAR